MTFQRVPKDPTERTSLRIPISVLAEVHARAHQEGRTFTGQVVWMLHQAMDAQDTATEKTRLVTLIDELIDTWSAGAPDTDIDAIILKLREILGH